MDVFITGKVFFHFVLISPWLNVYQHVQILHENKQFYVLKIKITGVRFLYHEGRIRQFVYYHGEKSPIF